MEAHVTVTYIHNCYIYHALDTQTCTQYIQDSDIGNIILLNNDNSLHLSQHLKP